jgi:hypothetical protein
VRASDQAFAMVFFISSSPSSYIFCVHTHNFTKQDSKLDGVDARRMKTPRKFPQNVMEM